MDFFNGIGKKISQTGQNVVQKTKDTAEVIKLNSLISDEEKKTNNIYLQIGQLYVSKYKENADEEFKILIEQVNDSLAEIERLKKQVQQIKGVKVCSNCGTEIPDDSLFCSGCGAKVVIQNNVDVNNFVKCNNCNNLIAKNMQFCTFCGSAIVQQTMPVNNKCCNCCGAVLEDDDVFCPECGSKVLSSEEV